MHPNSRTSGPRSSTSAFVACAGLFGLVLGGSGCDALEKYQERVAAKKATKELDTARGVEAEKRAALESKGEVYRVEGAGFSVPVPAGFSAIPDPTVAAGLGRSLALTEISRGAPEWFLASIVVMPTGEHEAINAATCAEAATAITTQGWTVTRSGMVPVAGSSRCQAEGVQPDEPNRGAMMTAMSASTETWVIMCNYDQRDEPAKAACAEALEGWRAESRGQT